MWKRLDRTRRRVCDVNKQSKQEPRDVSSLLYNEEFFEFGATQEWSNQNLSFFAHQSAEIVRCDKEGIGVIIDTRNTVLNK